MKSTYIAIFLAVLAASALGQFALTGTSGGFYVRTGSDPAKCALQFTYSLQPDKATIGQQYKTQTVAAPSALPDGCTAQNFVFTSFFANETLPETNALVPVAPSDPSNPVWNATFNAEWLYQNNGTGCVLLLPQTSRPGFDQYLCSVSYAGTPLYFAVWGIGNFTFDNVNASSSNAWIMNKQNYRITGASTLVIRYNETFPNISASLYANCGSNSSVIDSLSTQVTVTTATNLSDSLSGVWLAYSLVKRNNATASGDYLVNGYTSEAPLFTPGSGNGCWSLGVNYSAILPDLAYCAGGCKISFVFRDNSGVYVLETAGVSTGNGSISGGNGTGSGNETCTDEECDCEEADDIRLGFGDGTDTGNGTGVGTGTGTDNGNGNGNNAGPVSSASSMIFNAALLVISVAYLAWF